MPNSERPLLDPALALRRRRHRKLRRLRRRPDSRPRFKGLSFNRLVPNILTLIGLCAGLNGIRLALDGKFGAAAVALVIAACLDGLDGRIARLLRATSQFGAEFDSLSDFLCFGVAPAFILYAWTLHAAGPYGFVPCMMFAVCMGLRLARFNAGLGSGEERPAHASNFFTGVPAPAGAGLAMFPIFVGLEARHLHQEWLWEMAHAPLLVAALLIGVAALLVSTLPIWSFKNFKVPSAMILPVLLGVSVYVAVLVADPWAALAAAGLIYLVMIPFSRRSYHALRRDADALTEDDPETT